MRLACCLRHYQCGCSELQTIMMSRAARCGAQTPSADDRVIASCVQPFHVLTLFLALTLLDTNHVFKYKNVLSLSSVSA
jgi:hypothetical protein